MAWDEAEDACGSGGRWVLPDLEALARIRVRGVCRAATDCPVVWATEVTKTQAATYNLADGASTVVFKLDRAAVTYCVEK